MRIKTGQTILFIGDSITDCGRRDIAAPLGSGYVKLFHDMLVIRRPARRIAVINRGIGGDNVLGLRDRWHDDVLRCSPDWLSVKIGINDLHRGLNNDLDPISPDLYRQVYDELLCRTRKALPNCRLLLIDAFYISTDTSPNSFRANILKRIGDYIRVVHDMSKKHRTLLVKTHDIFQRLLKNHPPDTFCPEPVHPNLTGHMVIAEAVYSALST
jgi:lysophospholipase L1-like esterase